MHPQAHDEDDWRFYLCTYGVLVLALLMVVRCVSERPAHIGDADGSVMVPALYFTTIAVEKPAHFPTADGAMRLIPIGQYVVDSVDNAQLRLTPEDTLTPLVITAALQSHDIDISSPLVLAFAEQEDEPHVLLLLPDGRALDAIGSFSGIQSREIIRPHRRYTVQTGTGALSLTEKTIPFTSSMGTVPPVATKQIQSQLGTVDVAIKQIITDIDRQREKENNEQSRVKEMENQRAIPDGIQRIMSNYSQAQALAQSTLAKLNGRFQLEFNTDRPGGDYARRAEATPESCRMVCSSDPDCQAFTFVKPQTGSTTGQCHLKKSVPTTVADSCCVSAKRKSAQEE